MTTPILGGLCNSDHCAHPCCWSYYRKLIKHQINSYEIEDRKQRSIEVPYQSIKNINEEIFTKMGGGNLQVDALNQRDTKSNALMEYLMSRKKSSVPFVPHVTPNLTNIHLRDSTNVYGPQNRLATLDVHEIFDLDELHSDWRKTFQAKDYYVWMPGNKDLRHGREQMSKTRTIKTPVLQLAPVTDSRVNSSVHTSTRKDNSYCSAVANSFSQKTASLRLRAIPRVTVRTEPSSDVITLRTRETRNDRDYHRHKSLEAALNQEKMQIHNSNDKLSTRYDFFNTSQVYLMDENLRHDIRDICSSNQSRQPPTSPNNSEPEGHKLHFPERLNKINQVHFKGVSIIQSAPSEDNFNLKLEPQQERFMPRKLIACIGKDNGDLSIDDRSSICDSMATNAMSTRSTLNDDDILPGSSILQMLQNSYKLIQERSDNMTDRAKESIGNIEEPVRDREVQLHKVNMSYSSRTAKSAPDKKIIKMETAPNPPPPSPDTTDRFRSTSAAANINLCK